MSELASATGDKTTIESSQMDERSRRIVMTAMTLAEEGGFEAVRLRDVATHANVALGTVYKRFSSKEDMLVAALGLEMGRLAHVVEFHPLEGHSTLQRVIEFFTRITQSMMDRPNFTRAVLRAVVSGEPDLADKVIRFHSQMIEMIVKAITSDKASSLPAHKAALLANTLQQIWFTALVGWMGGLHGSAEAIKQVEIVAKVMLNGLTEKSTQSRQP